MCAVNWPRFYFWKSFQTAPAGKLCIFLSHICSVELKFTLALLEKAVQFAQQGGSMIDDLSHQSEIKDLMVSHIKGMLLVCPALRGFFLLSI